MDQSRLGLLPAELRNVIYELALQYPYELEIRGEPALLRTCKQIRAEAELMFYALNEFYNNIHESDTRPILSGWLKRKAGPRINSIRKLELRVEMPSVERHQGVVANAANGDYDEDNDEFFAGLLLMMHIMAMIRKVKFDRCYKCVVHFTVNGAPDSESFEKIEAMTLREQDRYQGAKFMLLSLMYGEKTTVDAMLDEHDAPARLSTLYDSIERHRAGGPWVVGQGSAH